MCDLNSFWDRNIFKYDMWKYRVLILYFRKIILFNCINENCIEEVYRYEIVLVFFFVGNRFDI